MIACGVAHAEITELEASYRFLVSDRTQGGVLFATDAKQSEAYPLPLSFQDSAAYWGEYVCQLAGNNCAVRDVYNPADYTLAPELGPAAELQVERVNVHNGTNIYDAATWQIAVMLGEVVNHFAPPNKQVAYDLVDRLNHFLAERTAARALSHGTVFVYNEQVIVAAKQAYAFRMLSRDWLATDPFKDTRYAALLSVDRLPNNPNYQLGKISWSDWKPISGENAWAFLLGPLQAAYIHYVLGEKQAVVPFHDHAVQNALALLPTFALMQAPIGAVYYAPQGTLDNQGKLAVSPHYVSVENNFSLYAGLKILQAVLRAELAHEASLSNSDKGAINAALATIDTMIHGGQIANRQTTAGLLAFFKTAAWKNGEFIQGGLANDPQQRSAWIPTLQPKAVDVNTWGVAALGAAQLDDWFGFGAAYQTWQQVKAWGGYGKGNAVWGVGYSDQDGNGISQDGKYRQGILSAEWTAGAINMVRNLLRHYQSIASSSAHYATAQAYVRALTQDELTMLTAVQSLRFGSYQRTDFPGKPPNYANLIQQNNQPYLYASKRYAIPFGWYANPLPSTCATAWMIMLANHYDPLAYAGHGN